MSEVVFHQATAEDFEAYFGRPPLSSFLAVVGETDEGVVGIGGASWEQGMWVAFMDVKDGFEPRKRELLQGTKLALKLVRSQASRLQATAQEEDVAPGFLKHFGFTQLTGSIYQWDR